MNLAYTVILTFRFSFSLGMYIYGTISKLYRVCNNLNYIKITYNI